MSGVLEQIVARIERVETTLLRLTVAADETVALLTRLVEAAERRRPAPPPLDVLRAAIDTCATPTACVDLWRANRTVVAELPATEREAAWAALCTKTEAVGKMKNAKAWLKKAIADADAAAAAAAKGAP